MTEYVAGFMFGGDNVALIRKTKPAWQAGRLNGIGGKIEPGETPIQAMVREFEEETGFKTYPDNWKEFVSLNGDGFVVHFFFTYGPVEELKTTTDEVVTLVPIKEVSVENAIPNLTWLLPMAQSMYLDKASSFQIREVYQ